MQQNPTKKEKIMAKKPEPEVDDPVIWRNDLMKRMSVTSETMRRWLKDGKLPKPDVDLSNRTRGWKTSTLRAAGINVA